MPAIRCSLVAIVLLGMVQAALAEKLDRGVVAVKRSDGAVLVSWRLLATDPVDVVFNVYAGMVGRDELQTVATALREATCFLHRPEAGDAVKDYIVRAVVAGREESDGSSLTSTAGAESFVRIPLQDRSVVQKAAVADLDGDGRYDYVVKQPDFNVDPYEKPGYWKKSEDTYKIEAYRHDGEFLWRHDMGWSIEEGIWYSPYVVFDLDGDGKAEVFTKAGEGDPRDPDGRVTSGPEWLVMLNGLTGKVAKKVPWPDRSGYEKYNYYCRNLLGIAYLDGRRPHLIVQRGTYTQIKMEAYAPGLDLVWRWNSRDEKERYSAQGMHGMHAADVDGDGRDEIVIGSAVIDDDGKGLWTRGVGHPDACYVGDILPQRPGLEIFYGIEPSQKRDAVCLVDARTGERIWGNEEPTKHVHHNGMAGDITAEYPGQECYAGEQDQSRYWLFTADGRRIGQRDLGGLAPRPVFWDADPQKELVRRKEITNWPDEVIQPIVRDPVTIADCLGDWREEIITCVPGELRIYTTGIPANTRRVCLMQNRLYRTDVAMASMGYFYPPQLGIE